jgi:predicted Zn finger-like uncharacterized protein
MVEMYTQCPDCRTIFVLRESQLKAHDGLVRCGKCAVVFRADQRMFRNLPVKQKESRSNTAVTLKKPTKPVPPVKSKRPEQVSQKKPRGNKSLTAPRLTPPEQQNLDIPLVTELSLFENPKPRTRTAFWIVGNLLLFVLLAGQMLYIYRNELVGYSNLKPLVLVFCHYLRCEVHPRRNVAMIELNRTSIAPHPKHAKALRIRASLVNRAGFTQPFPMMEVSLSSKTGELLSRRSFKPEEYLQQTDTATKGMPPNVIIEAALDVTNPDKKTVGYEILLHVPLNLSYENN